jgi:hypothetical protein
VLANSCGGACCARNKLNTTASCLLAAPAAAVLTAFPHRLAQYLTGRTNNRDCIDSALPCCSVRPADPLPPHCARVQYLTGRTNNRDCIDSALPCCQENVADTCSQGKNGALPWEEFTIAKAAKKSKLGKYSTIQLGKWCAAACIGGACLRLFTLPCVLGRHLGDLWDKKLPGMSAEKLSVSDPGKHGFDDWMTTQAEASNSMTNCGCFPKNHTTPGKKPNGGYGDLRPLGDQCVVGSGFESDWCACSCAAVLAC